MKTVFVTVGTTRFDALIQAVLCDDFCKSLQDEMFTHMILQSGNSKVPQHDSNISISTYDFKPSLHNDMNSADLIISHAGSGSILEALSLKKRLIVVINTELMDNHQLELACALENESLLLVATPESLCTQIHNHDELNEFIESDSSIFPNLLNHIMISL